jgi:hypothetical protein
MLKQIKQNEALQIVKDGGEVFILVKMDTSTTLGQLFQADGFVTDQSDPEPKPEPKPKKEPKTKTEKPKAEPAGPIDHGKIIALHKAGWSANKIAGEMGCTCQTVLNHIAREKDNVAEH